MIPPTNSGDGTNTQDDDPLGGMDPMAWLESLARRQGANPDELITSANLPIAELPPDTKPNEPGYTPGYEGAKSAPPVSSAPPPAPPPPEPEPVAASDDPFGGMDPMAWLESLARRQGANPDELITSANLPIAELPPDIKPQGPGYTPGYEAAKPVQFTPEPAPEPPAQEPEPVAASDDPFGGMDPMAWLESLARRQGANPDELITSADMELPPEPAAVGEPIGTDDFTLDGNDPMAWLADLSDAQLGDLDKLTEPPTPEPAASAVTPGMDEDPLGGMDPMAWLESLARRQGANPEELTTAANLDIPMPTADSVPTGPGYTDYDPLSARGVGTPRPEPEPIKEEPPAKPPITVPPVAEPEPVASAEDPFGGMDPMAWLESLAARQGANPDELMTVGKGTPPPPLPEPTVADYSIFEPGGTTEPMSADEAAKLFGVELEAPAAQPEAADVSDPLAWLESLASTPEQGLDLAPASTAASDLYPVSPEPVDTAMTPESALSWLEELTREDITPTPVVPARPAEAPKVSKAEMEGGLSNDPAVVQAWLEKQLHSLTETRDELETEVEAPDLEAPAEAGQLPAWLLESMPKSLEPAASTTPPLRDEIAMPAEPSDLPPWLTESDQEPQEEAALSFSVEDFVEELEAQPVSELLGRPLTDLDELTRPSSPEEVDDWAEALNEEYERRQAGNEDAIPDWYRDALSRAAVEMPPKAPEVPPTLEPERVAEEPLALAGELPDWLQSMSVETLGTPTPEAEALPGDIPPWLLEMSSDAVSAPSEPAPLPQGELPPWLREAAPTVEVTPALPAKPAPVVQEPPPPSVPVAPPTPVAPVTPPVTRPPVAPAAKVDVTVLAGARKLAGEGQLSTALERYQTIIDSLQFLEEARGDLRTLAERHPKEPKVFRLLGDAHMRLGDLQAALDTYLNALDQL